MRPTTIRLAAALVAIGLVAGAAAQGNTKK